MKLRVVEAVIAIAVGAVAVSVLSGRGSIAAQGDGLTLPRGTILPFIGETAPQGFVLANGAELDANDPKFSQLCKVLAGRFNRNGDRVGLCRLPHLGGRSLIGAGQYRPNEKFTFELLSTGGEPEHALTPEELAPHSHRVMGAYHPTGSEDKAPTPFKVADKQYGSTTLSSGGGLGAFWEYDGQPTSVAGQGRAVSTLPPYMAVSFIIKT